MKRTIRTLVVLAWLQLLLSAPHKTTAATPEYRSELRDYNLSKSLTIKTDTVAELSYVAPPFNLNNKFPNGFEPLNCTWFVASKIHVPIRGNANEWAAAAQAINIPVTSTPSVGAVAQTSRGGWGHVAIVEDIQGDMVKLIEMNVVSLGVIDEHWYPTSDYLYIYF